MQFAIYPEHAVFRYRRKRRLSNDRPPNLGTKLRFTRRLVAERRIRFTHLGRHVRIPESALDEFIKAGMVEPVTVTRKGRAA